MEAAELQEFIDRYNDAWNAHDVDAIVAMHTDDSVFAASTSGRTSSSRSGPPAAPRRAR